MNYFIQLRGLFCREVARYFKVPLQTLGASIVNTTLYLMIFGVSLGRSIDTPNTVSYLAFLIPGLIAMTVIKNAFDNASSAIIGPKYVNELQDLRVVPLTNSQIVWAKGLASLLRGLLVGLMTYLLGQCFFYFSEGQLLFITHPFALIYFLLAGGLSFGFLGMALGMWCKSFEQIGAASALILLPLIYLGGVFFTLERLDPIWQKISLFNPLFYIINGMRYALLGVADIGPFFSASIALLALLISYFCAHISLQKGPNFLR